MQITNESKLEGKIIDRIVFVDCDEMLVIIFTDGAHVVFGVEHGYGGEWADVILSTDKLENSSKLEAGLISQEEHDQVQKKETQSYKEQGEARERNLLKHLKEKYEGGAK